MTRSPSKRLGTAGVAAAALVTAATGLLGAAMLGGLPQPWLPQAAAGAGIVGGLLGCLGLCRKPPPPAMAPAKPAATLPADTMDNIAALLRGMAEEMVRLKRDGAEASRSMAEARQAGRSVVEAAGAAIARLDESAESSAIAARALSLLPGIADSHAQRIELMAARAEQALALVPDAMAAPPAGAAPPAAMLMALRDEIIAAIPQAAPALDSVALEAALARLEALPAELASAAQPPDMLALEAAVARLDALPGEIGAALSQPPPLEFPGLEAAIGRLEAARPDPMLALGVMEATERLDGLTAQLTQALTARPVGEPPPVADTAERDAALAETLRMALAPGLAEIMGRRFTALSNAANPAMNAVVERLEGAAGRLETLPEELTQAISTELARHGDAAARLETLPEAITQAIATEFARHEDAAARLEALPEALDAGLSQWRGAVERLDAIPADIAQAIDHQLGRWDGATGRLEGMPAAIAEEIGSHLTRWSDDLAAMPANLSAAAGRIEAAGAALQDGLAAMATQGDGLAEALPALLEARLAPLAVDIAAAAAAGAEGLQAHLNALETLGPVLDQVTERLIDTADSLAATGHSLPPMADAARRAMDSLALAAQSRQAMAQAAEPQRAAPAAAPRGPAPPLPPSVAASIMGRLAAQEEPAIAAALMRLDGIGSEVASLLRDTETLVGAGQAALSRPVARRAPELLESLEETIRGLQSISTAIAIAADRRLEHARAG